MMTSQRGLSRICLLRTRHSSVVGGVFGLTLISGLFSSNPEQKRSAQDFKTFDFINQTSQSLSPSFILSISDVVLTNGTHQGPV